MKEIPTKADAKALLVKSLSLLLSGLNFLASTQPGTYGGTEQLVDAIVLRIVTSGRGKRTGTNGLPAEPETIPDTAPGPQV